MVNSPFRKKAVHPTPPRQEEEDAESYADTYFREIGYKTGGNSLLGSAASNVPGDEILDDLDRSLGLLEDNSLSTDVERAVAAADAVSPPRTIGPAPSVGSSKGRINAVPPKTSNGYTFYNPSKSRTSKRRTGNTNDGKSPTEFAISYFQNSNTQEDASISTLGDGSLIRRVSPKNLGQESKPNQGAPKTDQAMKTSEPIDFTKTRTRSTLVIRPLDDNDHKKDVEGQADSMSSMSSWALQRKWRIIYCTIGVALLLLLASGAVLAISFMQLRDAQKNDNSGTDSRTPTWFPRDRVAWSRSPTSAPVEPTLAPSVSLLKLAEEDLLSLISGASPDSLSALSLVDSPQFRAFEWMVNDPDYFEYSIERILQRWSMAVLYFSTSGEMWTIPTNNVFGSAWLGDSNECLWYSTDENDVCDEDGMIAAIHLNDFGLSGSIPPELSLLSNSLERIYMSNNNITGTIPFEIGSLSHLVRLQLTSNSIEGTIPSELAMLSDLGVLGLGRNDMSGRLPEQLGQMDSLKILALEENRFDGTIPSSFGGMAKLELLALQGNELQGFVPVELASLEGLVSIFLHKNNFEGSVPIEFCAAADEGVAFLSADCMEIECECCTHCCMSCEGDEGLLTPVDLLDGRFEPDGDFNTTDYNTTDAPSDEFNITEAPSDEMNFTEAPSALEIVVTNETETSAPSNAPEVIETLSPSSAPDDETSETTSSPTGLFDVLRPILIDQQDNETLWNVTETDEPTSSPTVECVSTLSQVSTCVESDGPGLQVAYSSCNPTSKDWFGLFKKDGGEPFQVGQFAPEPQDSETWIRSCGDKECTRRSFEGTVTLGGDRLKVNEGEYQVILVRRLIIIAIIETVVVEKNCDDS